MVFQQNLQEKAYFIAKMSSLALSRLASSDFWKALLAMVHYNRALSVLFTLINTNISHSLKE